MSYALTRQIAFLLETDKLKEVIRLNQLSSGNRRENTAEHRWHSILQTLTFAEYAPEGTDISHVIKLLAVQDPVEIDAGDQTLSAADLRDTKEARLSPFPQLWDHARSLLDQAVKAGRLLP